MSQASRGNDARRWWALALLGTTFIMIGGPVTAVVGWEGVFFIFGALLALLLFAQRHGTGTDEVTRIA